MNACISMKTSYQTAKTFPGRGQVARAYSSLEELCDERDVDPFAQRMTNRPKFWSQGEEEHKFANRGIVRSLPWWVNWCIASSAVDR